MSQSTNSPEIGQSILAAGYQTNYHELGEGSGTPVMLLHGSGPGVTAWANWRLNMSAFAQHRRVIAPDLLGFGYTERPTDDSYSMDRWIEHLLGLLEALNVDQVDLIGNSFGGGLALHFAQRYPQRVRRLVLMGAVSIPFKLTDGLDAVWGYQPSVLAMRKLLDIFAFDRSLVNDELAELRYHASIREGVQESFSSMFPAPRQRWIDEMSSSEETLRSLKNETLIIHGRDDQVIPVSVSQRLFELIDQAQLHVFGRCGHWTQIEHTKRFNQLIVNFLDEKN